MYAEPVRPGRVQLAPRRVGRVRTQAALEGHGPDPLAVQPAHLDEDPLARLYALVRLEGDVSVDELLEGGLEGELGGRGRGAVHDGQGGSDGTAADHRREVDLGHRRTVDGWLVWRRMMAQHP